MLDFNFIIGNLTYLVFALSYLVTSMLWLRTLTIIAMVLEVVYFYTNPSNSLMVGIFLGGVVFIIINVIQISRLLHEKAKMQLSDDEK